MNEEKTFTESENEVKNPEVIEDSPVVEEQPFQTVQEGQSMDTDIVPSELTSQENISNDSKHRFNTKTVIILSICALVLIVAVLLGIGFKLHSNNVKAANNVVSMINDIGEIFATDETNEKITAAYNAYDALTDKQKKYVSNIGTLTDAKKTYDTKKADLNLVVLATALKSNAELCQAFFSDYAGVWYNAIYRKTDKYNNGDFSDFNNALRAFQSSDTYTNAQATLNTLNKTILNTLSELKEAPPSDTEAYDAIKNVYAAYQPMYELAVNPEGSYNSYTSEVQRLNGNYKSAYATLTIAMPTLALTTTN